MGLSLTHKMMAAVGAVSATALLALVGLSSMALRESSQELIDARMQATVQLAATTLADAVIGNDLARIDAIVDQILAGQYGAVRMCVFNRVGSRLSTCRCTQVNDEALPGTHVREAQIRVGKETFGNVGIAYEYTSMLPDLGVIERNLFLAAAFSLFSAVGMIWLLSRRFELELRYLVDSIEKMPAPRQLRRSSVHELDQIALRFNELLERRRSNDNG